MEYRFQSLFLIGPADVTNDLASASGEILLSRAHSDMLRLLHSQFPHLATKNVRQHCQG